MARKARGSRTLAIATLLGLLASPVEASARGLPPAIHLAVLQDAVSEKLVCRVTKTLPPTGKGDLIIRIRLPQHCSLKSALLKTATGELALDVMDAALLNGDYATIIDSTKAHCATSGNLVLDVEGEFEASTIGCPEISLFDARVCDESPSGRR
jgi:hypothetical protein